MWVGCGRRLGKVRYVCLARTYLRARQRRPVFRSFLTLSLTRCHGWLGVVLGVIVRIKRVIFKLELIDLLISQITREQFATVIKHEGIVIILVAIDPPIEGWVLLLQLFKHLPDVLIAFRRAIEAHLTGDVRLEFVQRLEINPVEFKGDGILDKSR